MRPSGREALVCKCNVTLQQTPTHLLHQETGSGLGIQLVPTLELSNILEIKKIAI